MVKAEKIAIGEKIKKLRIAKRLGQDALAKTLGISIPSVSKLENNIRQVKAEEIPKLYSILGCTASELFGDEDPPVISETSIQFRSSDGIDPDSQLEMAHILGRLGRQVKNLVDIENTLAINIYNALPRSWEPAARNIKERHEQANDLANLLRMQWALGSDPIHNLEIILEEKSVIWARWTIPDVFSGICAQYNNRAVILLNASEPWYRQKFSLAHELCHAILDGNREVVFTRKEDLYGSQQKYPPPIEHRANIFSGRFLMPLYSAKAFARQNGFDLHDPTGRQIMQLAYYFGMSGLAVINTLRNYGMINWAKQQELREGTQPLPEDALPHPDPLNSWCDKSATEIQSLPRLIKLGFQAYFEKKINEGSLSELLNVDRTKLIQLLKDYKVKFLGA